MFYCDSCKQRSEKLKKKRSKSKSKKGDNTSTTATTTVTSIVDDEIPLAQTRFRDKRVCNKCFCDSIITRIRFTMQKEFKDFPTAAPVPVILEVDDTPRSLELYHIVHDSYPPETRRIAYTTSPPRTFNLIPVHITIPGKTVDSTIIHNIPDVKESTYFNEFPEAIEILDFLKGNKNQLIYSFIKKVLIKNALIFEAQKAKALAILTGETADDLSALVISDTAMGRGSKVATDTCVMDTQTFAPIAIMRPLREFYAEETKQFISIKFNFNKNEEKSDDDDKKDSSDESVVIDDNRDKTEIICSEFLHDMQGPFGHTMFTILGSIDRLEVGGRRKNQCTVCRSFIAEIPDCESEESDLCSDFGTPLCRACGLMLKRMPDSEFVGRIVAFFESMTKILMN